MRDYVPQKGKYILPTPVYHVVLWQIRDYYRLKETADSILEESAPPSDGMPHGTPSPDGVLNKAARRLELLKIVEMIDDEMQEIPQEYRRGVWNNILYRTSFPHDADRSTYGRYKSRMIYRLAIKQGLINE